MARYFGLNILPKMEFFTNFANFDMQRFQGVSPSIGRRDMYYSLLDSSRQGASNGGRFMSLASLDGKLFAFYALETFANNFLSIDARDMKYRHSMRIVMTNPTSHNMSFYDH